MQYVSTMYNVKTDRNVLENKDLNVMLHYTS